EHDGGLYCGRCASPQVECEFSHWRPFTASRHPVVARQFRVACPVDGAPRPESAPVQRADESWRITPVDGGRRGEDRLNPTAGWVDPVGCVWMGRARAFDSTGQDRHGTVLQQRCGKNATRHPWRAGEVGPASPRYERFIHPPIRVDERITWT